MGLGSVCPPELARLIRHRKSRVVRRLEELTGFFDNAPCGYHALDAEGRIVRINGTELAWLGYARDEVVSRRLLRDFVAPEGRERFDANFARLLAEGFLNNAELDLVRRDGSVFTVLQTCTVVRDLAGRHLMTRCILVDITARKLIEDALRLSEARLADSQRIAKLGNWVWNLRTNDLWWSNEIFRIFGLEPEGFDATYEAFLATVHPEDRAAVKGAVDAALHRKEPYAIDHRIVRPDGQERIVHEQAEVTYDLAGAPRAMSGTVQDVTEYRSALAAIAKRTADLEQAQELERLRTAFVNAVAHDLRQPITAIRGYSELLDDELEGPLNPAQRNDVRQILHDARRLETLVEELLDAVRIDAGLLTLHLEPIAVAQMAAGTIASLRPQATQKQLQLSLRLAPDLPPALLDRTRIERVLVNLVENAIKFTPPGRAIAVGVRQEGGLMHFEVVDEGPGIEPDDIPKLFRRFSQVGGGSAGGLGLGLSTCKAIVEAHGGRVGVETTPGAGSRFWFALPVSGPERPAARG